MDVIVVLESTSIRVEPGNEASTTARVRNTGQIVDEFTIEGVGEPAGWMSIEPASVSLFPGAEATVQVRFRPARIPASRAGRMPFGIKATSRVDRSRSAVEEGIVEVLPFRDEGLSLVPRTSRGWRGATHDLTVTNGGNGPITATPSVDDPDRLLTFDVQPPTMSIEPAGSRVAHIRLSSRDAPLVGGSTRIPFSVSVNTGSGTPLVTDGAFERRSPLPPWLVAAAAGMIGLVAIAILLALINGPGVATPTPQTATASPDEPTLEPSIPESAPPTVTPEALTCSGVFTTDTLFNVSATSPSVVVDRRACLIRVGMFTPGSGSGPIRLTLDGVDFLRFDMAEYDSIGHEGAGSGEREVDLAPAVSALPAQTISLDVTGCAGDGCGEIHFWISVANAP